MRKHSKTACYKSNKSIKNIKQIKITALAKARKKGIRVTRIWPIVDERHEGKQRI